MMNPIPYGRQSIDEADIEAVIEVLSADYLTQGPKILEFEQDFAKYVGADYAVAVSNGTAALHLAIMALGLQPGDVVICTPITFAASSNCVKYCGGEVIFADIDPETYLIDISSIKSILEANKDKNIKGIIPVDFAGRVPQMDAIQELANANNLWVLEDACHSPGGYFLDRSGQKQLVGNGKMTDLSVFSFHPVKHIATGEGGMITTNNPTSYKKLLALRTHGITKEVNSFKNSKAFANGNSTDACDDYPAWYMEMQDLGYNYRLTDIQAALGITQLKKADLGLEKRRAIAEKYTAAFKEVSQVIRSAGNVDGHAYHLYVLEVENRRGLYDHLAKHKIYAQIHYIPVHLMPFYRKDGWKEGDLVNAETYYSRCISLPMFPTLKSEEQQFVIDQVKGFYGV